MAGNWRSGRKPLPTHLKLITGNPGRKPLNEYEPRPPAALPTPPPELNEDGRIEWDRVAIRLYTLGILTAIDRGVLAAYCQAYGRWIRAERALSNVAATDKVFGGILARRKNGNLVVNPLVNAANKAMDDMRRLASEFGMTPSARSRIRADGQVDRNDPAAKYFTR